jgi:hypothetical protein
MRIHGVIALSLIVFAQVRGQNYWNVDFTYAYAAEERQHDCNDAGVWTRYIGLPSIHELVNQYGWSTTHHGTAYRLLTSLAPDARMQVYDLSPFEQSGFTTQWCFSIPDDDVSPEIYAEIQALNRFSTVRRQGDKRPAVAWRTPPGFLSRS